jgi:predicted nucleotidyltransferase
MMKRQTVEQILLVFRLFREGYARGKPLHKAYQEAVREVADRHGVTYQTIGDGCRRRLMLGHIGELYALLGSWAEGDSEPLVAKLNEASDPSAHEDIAEFFTTSTNTTTAQHPGALPQTSGTKADVFSLRLSEQDARRVRALAEMEGISPSELLGRLVGSAVDEKMKRVAQAILRDAAVGHRRTRTREQILKILRDHEAELRDLGAEHVSLFGSVARGEAAPASDVDLAVRLRPGFSQGGFDYFGRFETLRTRLAQILGCAVDLVEEPVETGRLQSEIDADRVHAF